MNWKAVKLSFKYLKLEAFVLNPYESKRKLAFRVGASNMYSLSFPILTRHVQLSHILSLRFLKVNSIHFRNNI